MLIKLKRVYEKADVSDGYRMLVDRLWPRGISKAAADLDEWSKDLAPSDQLRGWYSHDAGKWPDFKQRYFAELSGREELIRLIAEKALTNTVTFVYAAKDEEHNNAAALKEYVETFINRDRVTLS